MRFEGMQKCNGKLIDDFSAFSKVLSLTEVGINSMPMWAHYANDHHGFCISYDMYDSRNIDLKSVTSPVQYIDKRIDITPIMEYYAGYLTKELKEQIMAGEKEILLNDLTLVFLPLLFGNLKHSSWAYEKEFRANVGATIDGMPYFPAHPKEIYIGIKCEEKYVERLTGIASKLCIPAYKMFFEEHSENFGLSYRKLN